MPIQIVELVDACFRYTVIIGVVVFHRIEFYTFSSDSVDESADDTNHLDHLNHLLASNVSNTKTLISPITKPTSIRNGDELNDSVL